MFYLFGRYIHMFYCYKGLLITGGIGAIEAQKSIEIFDMENNRSCQMDDLPSGRYTHTQVSHYIVLEFQAHYVRSHSSYIVF